MCESFGVLPGQWLRGTIPEETGEDADDARSNTAPHSELDELIESIIEEHSTAETPAELDTDVWVLQSLRHLNELCQTRRNSLVSAEQHLEQARAEFKRATVAVDAARKRYEVFERGVDEGRLCLAQWVGKELGREERDEMQRKVNELVNDMKRSPDANGGGAIDPADLSVEEPTPTSAGSSLGSTSRLTPSMAPMETPLLHAKSRRGMPTSSSMPRVTDAGLPSPQALSRRRNGWDLHREFLLSSGIRLP